MGQTQVEHVLIILRQITGSVCEHGYQRSKLSYMENWSWCFWHLIFSFRVTQIPKSFSLAPRRSPSAIISILSWNVGYRRILHGGYNVLLGENITQYIWSCFSVFTINNTHISDLTHFQKPLYITGGFISDHSKLTSTRAWSRRCVRGPKGHPSSGDSCWDSDFFNKESTSTADEHKDEY